MDRDASRGSSVVAEGSASARVLQLPHPRSPVTASRSVPPNPWPRDSQLVHLSTLMQHTVLAGCAASGAPQ